MFSLHIVKLQVVENYIEKRTCVFFCLTVLLKMCKSPCLRVLISGMAFSTSFCIKWHPLFLAEMEITRWYQTGIVAITKIKFGYLFTFFLRWSQHRQETREVTLNAILKHFILFHITVITFYLSKHTDCNYFYFIYWLAIKKLVISRYKI